MARSRAVLAPLATAYGFSRFAVSAGLQLSAKVAMACVAALFNSYSFVAPRQAGAASIPAAAITAAVAPAAAQAAVDMPEADEVHCRIF
ncbi:unnamed protein product [Symbiodinium sp. CCMP2592]|nr:unnamed protein product [Symbiodinium sp. CCMP2592]